MRVKYPVNRHCEELATKQSRKISNKQSGFPYNDGPQGTYKITYILLFLLLSILTGCGFHLRGNVKLNDNFQKMVITSDNPYGEITLELKQILGHSGVTLEDQPGPQVVTLALKNERYHTNTFSQSASSKTTQYTLVLDVDYTLENSKGEALYGPKTITTQANYTVNQDAVLTTTTQEDITRLSLQKQAVYLLLEQLNSPAVSRALQAKTKNKP